MAEIQVPVLRFAPAQPVNLAEMLEAQARRLIEVGVPSEVGVNGAKFLDDAMGKAKGFVYSVELASIGLDRVVMVHYGVRDRYLAEVGDVKLEANPDKFVLYKGVIVPEGLHVFHGQLGLKYKGKRTPLSVRRRHNLLEKLGIATEGLTAFLYWGKNLLNVESCMDFPGSCRENNMEDYVPDLRWLDSKANLSADYGGIAHPYYGSVTRGK